MPRAYRAGEAIEDACRAWKTDRLHTVVVVDPTGTPIRVTCDYCHTEHNYRAGHDSTSEGSPPVIPAAKWRGGTLVLRPGQPGLQEKSWPIETFFHKIVMLRNRLRTLEQQLNASDLPDDVKVKLQAYVSGCYGTLTSFNVLFADERDQFKGSGGD
jgi:hypothetical protein